MPKIHWKSAALIALAAALVLYMMSLGLPAEYHVCTSDYHNDPKDCPQYHLGNAILLWTVGIGDAHEGLLTALGTLIIALFTWTLWRSGERSGEHFRATERAYIKMSHLPPGITWDLTNDLKFSAVIEIKNLGSTPARVSDMVLTAAVYDAKKTPPVKPEYVREPGAADVEAFLVTNDLIKRDGGFEITMAQREAIFDAKAALYVYGYLDYRDQFGVRHRRGYGRVYDRTRENNLVYLKYRGYNYDRKRAPGEGTDWDEV